MATTDTDAEDILRTARIRRDKVIKFSGVAKDGTPVTWYVAYRGTFGWSACRENGRWMDEPSDEDVEAAVREYDTVELLNRSDTPEEVTL